jgi:hypothetical protein
MKNHRLTKTISLTLILSILTMPFESNRRFNKAFTLVAHASEQMANMEGLNLLQDEFKKDIEEELKAQNLSFDDVQAKLHHDLDKAIEKLESQPMNEIELESKLDSAILKLQNKVNNKVARMSERKAKKQILKLQNILAKTQSDDAKIQEAQSVLNDETLTAKEKLQALNSSEASANKIKTTIMEGIKRSGSVLNFVKELKQKINAKNQFAKRDGGSGGYISLGGLLLITGIILVALGVATTLGWALIIIFGIIPIAIILIYLLVTLIIIIVSAQNTTPINTNKPSFDLKNFSNKNLQPLFA